MLEYKNISTVSTGTTEVKDDGVVEALVSVTGIVDNVDDVIEPGAYTKTLAKRTAKGVWSHDWNTPIARSEQIVELMPGDPALPKTLANGEPWPAEAGALYVKTRFNLETQRGKEAFSDVKFFGKDTEWSIGYKVPKGGATKDEKTGYRHIRDIELYEYSPVLFGAASNARTLISTAKSLVGSNEDFLAEVKSALGIEVAENTPQEVNKEELDLAAAAVEEANAERIAKGEKSEERAIPVEVNLTAESMAQIKALHDQLGAVLEAINTIPAAVVEEEFVFESEKSIREATDALVENKEFDIEKAQSINDSVTFLEKAIAGGKPHSSISVLASDALDEITFALQDEKTDDPTKENLKTLVAAIGNALQGIEGTEAKSEKEEVVEETPVEEVKTVKVDKEEFQRFLDSLKG